MAILLLVECRCFSMAGGLFHSDNQDAEIAFRYALIRENMYNARLEFVPIIRRIDATDSYQAEKAGQ